MTYIPPKMTPARPDANDAQKIMSRDGDKLIPAKTPIHMSSKLRGGMQ